MSIVKQIAKALDGGEYLLEVSNEIKALAQRENVVIVFGASDDLIEFRGAIDDEASAYEGGTVLIDGEGVLPINEDGTFHDSVENIQEACQIVNRFNAAIQVKAIWCPESFPGASWAYELPCGPIDSATFDVMEDDEIYCQGVVFQLPVIK